MRPPTTAQVPNLRGTILLQVIMTTAESDHNWQDSMESVAEIDGIADRNAGQGLANAASKLWSTQGGLRKKARSLELADLHQTLS